jgi:hypothetical protein
MTSPLAFHFGASSPFPRSEPKASGEGEAAAGGRIQLARSEPKASGEGEAAAGGRLQLA